MWRSGRLGNWTSARLNRVVLIWQMESEGLTFISLSRQTDHLRVFKRINEQTDNKTNKWFKACWKLLTVIFYAMMIKLKCDKEQDWWFVFTEKKQVSPWWWEEEQSDLTPSIFSLGAKQLQSISDYVTGNDPWRGPACACVCTRRNRSLTN